jgi:hypothetical protein
LGGPAPGFKSSQRAQGMGRHMARCCAEPGGFFATSRWSLAKINRCGRGMADPETEPASRAAPAPRPVARQRLPAAVLRRCGAAKRGNLMRKDLRPKPGAPSGINARDVRCGAVGAVRAGPSREFVRGRAPGLFACAGTAWAHRAKLDAQTTTTDPQHWPRAPSMTHQDWALPSRLANQDGARWRHRRAPVFNVRESLVGCQWRQAACDFAEIACTP